MHSVSAAIKRRLHAPPTVAILWPKDQTTTTARRLAPWLHSCPASPCRALTVCATALGRGAMSVRSLSIGAPTRSRGWLRVSDSYEFRHQGLLDHLAAPPNQ